MNEVMTRPYQRWPAGVSGNLNGRPPGARGQFSEEVLRTLRKVFVIEGEAAMIRTAKENPSAFTAICARLLPTEVSASIEHMMPRGIDADDVAILKAIRAAIPDANSRSPDQVLEFVLRAVRQADAKLIDVNTDAQIDD